MSSDSKKHPEPVTARMTIHVDGHAVEIDYSRRGVVVHDEHRVLVTARARAALLAHATRATEELCAALRRVGVDRQR